MKRLLFAISIGTVAACGGSGGGGDASYLFPLWVPTDVVVTDVDRDGRADVLTIAQLSTSMTERAGRLTVYRQTGDGAFASPDTYTVGVYPWRLAVGDVDGDGLPDLVVTDVDGRAAWLLVQDSRIKGRFLAPQQIASGLRAYQAVIADLDGDGVPDIGVTDGQSGANRIVALYQDPAHRGTFRPAADIALPGGPSYVVAGDLDGDGSADLVTWIYTTSSGYTPNGALGISLRPPGGTPGAVSMLAPQTGLNAETLATADYDGDGRQDLVTFFTPFSTDYRAKLTVLLQGPAYGAWSAPVDTSLAGVQGIDSAVVADLNGDGRPEVAVVGFYPVGSPSTVESKLHLYTQTGGGAFALAREYAMPIAVSRVAAGDVDGDGRIDLVVFGGKNECRLMLQSRTTPGSFDAPRTLP